MYMRFLEFDWDERKAAANFRKHGVRFEDATHVFRDPLRSSVEDRIEDFEMRWHTVGVAGEVLLLVVHTHYEDENGNEIIRLISARHATRKERRSYENENG